MMPMPWRVVYRDYQELQLAREGLTRIYALTLTLTVLVALFGAFALAFVMTRRLSAPLSILAEGSQAVAQGDFSPRQAVYSRDELGILTQSFSRMTRQLDDARGNRAPPGGAGIGARLSRIDPRQSVGRGVGLRSAFRVADGKRGCAQHPEPMISRA